jgi:ABC-type transport system involved in multi-copper enzyme maturation permease subunit
MTVLPIVARELRVASRRRGTYGWRFGAAAGGILISAVALVSTRDLVPAKTGVALFSTLSWLSFLFCLFAGALQTAVCVSEEKREGTLGLLFLTDLKGYDVVLGKLAANSLNSIYGLLAIVPLLALPLFIGGVEPQAFWRMGLVLLNTLFLSLAAGIFVSSISRESRRATIAAAFLLLLITGGAPLLGLLYAYAVKHQQTVIQEMYFLAPSPGFDFGLVMESVSNGRPSPLFQYFWVAFMTVHGLGWVFLGLASYILPRTWQDKPAGPRAKRWQALWQRWAYGAAASRQKFRARLLEINPVYWLTGRYRAKRTVVWISLAVALALWCWGFIKLRGDWLAVANSLWMIVLVHGYLKLWIASEACRCFLDHRQSGALELLLSTPLRVSEIFEGQFLALKRQFGSALIAVLMADLLLLMAGLRSESSHPTEQRWILLCFGILMFTLVMDYYALGWVGMWGGLSARTLNRAAGVAIMRILILPWVLFYGSLLLYFISRLQRVYEPDGPEPVFLWWFAITFANNLFFIQWSKRRLTADLRWIASQPFAHGHKRGWWPFGRGTAAARLAR